MRILVTGSRDWPFEGTVRRALRDAAGDHPGPTLVHGGCPTGADAMADRIWREWGFPVEVFEADWDKHGRKVGPIRNQQMVHTYPDVCLAFPMGVELVNLFV